VPLPAAIGELAIVAAKSEAATYMLKRLGEYVWPKFAGATDTAAPDDPLAHIIEDLAKRPNRDELARALEDHEERLAALLDARSAADLQVLKRWLIRFGALQLLTLAAAIAIIIAF
jgi:hypothetical protein